MKVNGKELKARENMTVSILLKEQGFRAERVAVELNGEICPKSQYDNVILKDDDVIEIVSFVGGG